MSGGRPPVVAVVGPTASGKTALAIALARRLEGELVNGDSRQMIAELQVGVAKPEPCELGGVVCHGLDWRRVGRPFTAFDFVARADPALAGIAARQRVPIVVGGTGLYLRALLRGFDFGQVAPRPPVPAGSAGAGADGPDLTALAAELARVGPELAGRVDLRNRRRVVRALELARAGAVPGVRRQPWPAVLVARRLSAAALRRRIEERSRRLMGPRLLAEVERILAGGVPADVLAGAAIGYAEALAWRSGRCGREEAAARVALRTWRYGRQQRTWLRREPQVVWLGDDASCDDAVADRAAEVVVGALGQRQPGG